MCARGFFFIVRLDLFRPSFSTSRKTSKLRGWNPIEGNKTQRRPTYALARPRPKQGRQPSPRSGQILWNPSQPPTQTTHTPPYPPIHYPPTLGRIKLPRNACSPFLLKAAILYLKILFLFLFKRDRLNLFAYRSYSFRSTPTDLTPFFPIPPLLNSGLDRCSRPLSPSVVPKNPACQLILHSNTTDLPGSS